VATPAAAAERQTIVIRPQRRLAGRGLRELWTYRELAYFFIWRDLKVRYKQTLLGASWAILQPFLLMVVFSVFLGHLAKLPSNDLPYPVFSFAALVPWTLYSAGLASAADSMVGNAAIVTKVYFPRLLLPLAAVVVPLVDFVIALAFLGLMLVYYGVSPSIGLLALPGFTAIAIVTALGVGSLLTALNVRYRDFRYVIPFLLQFWLFATPVAYAANLIPERWRVIYGVNPMASVVEGFRWALLGTDPPAVGTVLVSVAVAVVALLVGVGHFRRTERTFADIM
jgi:lipopolysaccharide transport system permease protein